MTDEDRPLWQRLSDAADVLAEVADTAGFCGITATMARAAHRAASQLQREAVDAAERDQLIEDVATYLYRLQVSSVSPFRPFWESLPPDHYDRVRYRLVAGRLAAVFDIRRVEVPF